MESYSVDEPVYALATAYAVSALAVVRTSGKGSILLLSKAFSRPRKLLAAANASLVHGHISDSDGTLIDEVVLAVYKEGHGYTGEEAVEISTHGSPTVLRRLFVRLEELGFRQARRGEFTFRAFMHGRMDLTQAEAVEEIVSSRSVHSQEKALERLSGSLRRELGDIRRSLVEILASLEVQLDYAEDEILEDWLFPDEEVDGILHRLGLLASSYGAGRLYRDGAIVVLAGEPNAGKSSLFNLLVKEDRAIVSPQPGTTRDYIEAECEIAGLPVRLYDTAGLRTGGDEIEDEGIRRARSLFEKADLIVYLVEPGRPLPDDIDLERTLIVHSKSDLACGGGLAVSSMTGEGVGLLIDKIGERLHEGEVVQGAEGPSIDSERQLACIRSCIQALEAARDNRNQSVDIMALFFQGALEQLGLITGEVTNEEILDTLFSKFCLGK